MAQFSGLQLMCCVTDVCLTCGGNTRYCALCCPDMFHSRPAPPTAPGNHPATCTTPRSGAKRYGGYSRCTVCSTCGLATFKACASASVLPLLLFDAVSSNRKPFRSLCPIPSYVRPRPPGDAGYYSRCHTKKSQTMYLEVCNRAFQASPPFWTLSWGHHVWPPL